VEEEVLTSMQLSFRFPPSDHGDDDDNDDVDDYKAHAMSACLFVIAPMDIAPEMELLTDVSSAVPLLSFYVVPCRMQICY